MLTIGMILSPLFTLQAVEVSSTAKPAVSATAPKEIDKAKLEEFKAKLKQETDVLRTNLGTSKTEIEKKLADISGAKKVNLALKSQEKIKIALEKIYNKFNTQTGKLSQVDVKISAKISNLEKEGVDMTKAKAQYQIAKVALDKAISDILATRMISMEQVNKEISKDTLRTLVKSSEEIIKTAASEYRKILPLIAQANGSVKSVDKE